VYCCLLLPAAACCPANWSGSRDLLCRLLCRLHCTAPAQKPQRWCLLADLPRCWTAGLFACMKNRKLGDAMYFFEGMKKRGMQLDVRPCCCCCC
jgi:pentatricopeptide repeat protein